MNIREFNNLNYREKYTLWYQPFSKHTKPSEKLTFLTLTYANVRMLIKELEMSHCVKSFRVRSFSGLYFPAFGLNTDQKNSEYGHFLRSVSFSENLANVLNGWSLSKIKKTSGVMARDQLLSLFFIIIITNLFSVDGSKIYS